MIDVDDGPALDNVSPETLRRQARLGWDAEFAMTCGCDVRTHGVRFEAAGMCCGNCDRPVVRRRAA